MKFAYAVIVLILATQSVFAAPIDAAEATDPELRGFWDTALEAVARPILSGLTSTGQAVINSGSPLISYPINGVINAIGNFLNTALGSVVPYARPKNEKELLDIIKALVDEFNSEQNGGTVTESGNDSIVSQNDIMELVDNVNSGNERRPLYVVMLDDLIGLK